MAEQAPEGPGAALEAEGATLAAALGAAKEAAVAAERRVAALARSLERVEAEAAEARRQLVLATPAAAAAATGVAEEDWRDWGNVFGDGLPVEVLAKVAETFVRQAEAAWRAWLEQDGVTPEYIEWALEKRKRQGPGLFVFALVCKAWRRAQLRVGGGRLCTRVESDVIPPGRIALAEWALKQGCPNKRKEKKRFPDICSVAAEQGRVELVQKLIKEQGFAGCGSAIKELSYYLNCATRSGSLELVRWLRGEGCPWNRSVPADAAHRGHLKILQWARADGCRWNTNTCASAARGGKLATLQWLRATGCPWDLETCWEAAANGHLDVLRWAREHGAEWDWTTCEAAVEYGHVETLRWARENGCPWDAETRDEAAEKLGYTDDFGNLVDYNGNPVYDDDEYGSDEYSSE